MDDLLAAHGFMPRTMCGPAWTDGLVAWQVSSNAVIAICYLGIAAWLIAHRRMLPIGMLWVLFSSFIAMCARESCLSLSTAALIA